MGTVSNVFLQGIASCGQRRETATHTTPQLDLPEAIPCTNCTEAYPRALGEPRHFLHWIVENGEVILGDHASIFYSRHLCTC